MRSFKLEPYNVYNKTIRYELSADVPQDVYEKNYSTVKSPYGLDSLSDGTYTGSEELSTDGSPATIIYTNTGEVLVTEGRYRDTSASVILQSIDTYGATISTAPTQYSPEWLETDTGEYLSRWIKSDIDATVTLAVGPSLMASDPAETAILANSFPEWMEIRTDTTSNGYRLLQVTAEDIEDIKFQAITYPQRSFITMIPEGIKTFAYLSELQTNDYPISVTALYDESPYNLIVLSPAESLREFIEAEDTKHIYYIDGKYLMTSGEYDVLTIDSTIYPQEKIHIVNMFDHIGAYFSLPRLPDEENSDYKDRIFDVYDNPPGASFGRIKAAIERDSGINIFSIDELIGGHVPGEIENDPAVSGLFYTEPTDEQIELARWCREHGAIGWDYFVWGNTLFDLYPHPWDLAELPYLLDHTLDEESPAVIAESGIGFGDDLYPQKYEAKGTFPYSITVSANGFLSSTETIYPPVTVSGRIVPSATKTIYENELDGYCYLEITYESATYIVNIPVFIPRDELEPVNTNVAIYELAALSTEQIINAALATDTEASSISITVSDITGYELNAGYWDFATQAVVDNDTDSDIRMSFNLDVDKSTWVVSEESDEHPTYVYCDNNATYSTSESEWVGDGSHFSITCNKNNSAVSESIDVPRNLELETGLGTVTYTLVVDSYNPSLISFTGTPADTTIAFSSGGDTIVDYPPVETTIDLSSTYQSVVTKYTPYTHSSTIVLSGTLTEDETVAVQSLDPADFSLPAEFSGGTYQFNITGEVYLRADYSITDLPIDVYIELNPIYMFEWPPSVKPGTLYLDGEEYYLHADEEVETVTGTDYTLLEPIAPGFPISLSEDLVEIHFTGDDGIPTLTITQTVSGNGTQYLPIWYNNAVNITVDDVAKSLLSTNIVDYGSDTDVDTEYEISYQVTDSYCVDYAYYSDGEYRPRILLQAEHVGMTVTYTPFNPNGYWIDTDIPTNPLFTMKNRDFLYIDTSVPIVDSVKALGNNVYLYNSISNSIWARAIDSDGNGISGVLISFISDNGEELSDCYTDDDGYAYTLLEIDDSSPAPTTITVTASDGASPANTDSFEFTVVYDTDTDLSDIVLISQEFQVAQSNQPLQQVIKLLLLDSDGAIRTGEAGSYSVYCSDSSGNVSSTPISSDETTGIITLSYTPTEVGRYVATFTFDSNTKEVGWTLVERF